MIVVLKEQVGRRLALRPFPQIPLQQKLTLNIRTFQLFTLQPFN
jgi:hypothetical protein